MPDKNESCNNEDNFRACNFSFTLYNYEEKEIDSILMWFDKSNRYAMQEEKCPSTGKKHIQGSVEFSNARSRQAFKNVIGRDFHITKSKKKECALFYCTKSKTRCGRRWTKGIVVVEDPLENKILYSWQNELIEHLDTIPNGRTVRWYYDEDGNKGKTAFAKSCCIKSKANILVGGKVADMKFAIAKMIENHINPKTIFINITRSYENYVSYEGIEALLDGIFFSPKYESGMVMYNPCHLVIFANFEPNESAMSRDRWDIRRI